MKVLNTWTVKRNDRKGSRSRCEAECGCGSVCEYDLDNVKRGNTTRCRECAIKSRAEKRATHKKSSSFKGEDPEGYATYTIWQAIKRRCNNESDVRFNDYGGRGISIDESWAVSFERFISDMGIRPSPRHQIDRIDNNGDYEPSNCRWATRKENARNKRNNVVLSARGMSMCVSEWSEILGVSQGVISARIRRGWSEERALFGDRHKKVYNTPEGQFKTLKEVQEFYSMSSSGVHSRFKSKNFPDWRIE